MSSPSTWPWIRFIYWFEDFEILSIKVVAYWVKSSTVPSFWRLMLIMILSAKLILISLYYLMKKTPCRNFIKLMRCQRRLLSIEADRWDMFFVVTKTAMKKSMLKPSKTLFVNKFFRVYGPSIWKTLWMFYYLSFCW